MVASRALRTLQICALTALCIACEPPSDIRASKNGELYPASVYRGTEILMKLTHSGTDFSACDSLHKWTYIPIAQLRKRFVFTMDNSEKPISNITFVSLEHVGPNNVSIRLNIGKNVVPGYYQMQFECSGESLIPARFYVDESKSTQTLVFDPPQLYAGKSNQTVKVTLRADDGTISVPDTIPSSVIFYPYNVKITADDIEIITDSVTGEPREMQAVFTVSDLALSIVESSKTITVFFVDSPYMYSGELTVKPDNMASVSVTPRRVEKPMAGDTDPNVIDVTLEGKNISFIEGQSSNTNGFSITVPENPGVHVGPCHLNSTNMGTAVCTLKVDNSAFPGPTLIKIKSGDVTTYTSVNVVPEDFNDLMVRFHPPVIDNCTVTECELSDVDCLKKYCPPQTVVAEMLGTEFDDSWQVATDSSMPNAIDVSKTQTGPNHWILRIVADGAQVHDDIGLTFSSGDKVVHSHLLVRDIAGQAFRVLDSFRTTEPNPRQGNLWGNVRLNLQNVAFNSPKSAVSAVTPPRSGVAVDSAPWLVSSFIDFPGGAVFTNLKPTIDAPTGPSMLQIDGATVVSAAGVSNSLSELDTNLVWFLVDPADASTAYVTAEPNTIWLGSSTARVTFKGEREMVLNESTQILLADPSLHIANVAFDAAAVDGPVAVVDLNVSPSSIAGLKPFYFVNPDGQRAAVNIRGIKTEKELLGSVEPPAIHRRDAQGKIKVGVTESFQNAPVALSMFDNIGVSIERWYYTSENRVASSTSVTNYYLVVIFSLDEEGPGGWVGVSVSQSGKRYVIPVKIVAMNEDGEEDDSLTATVNREYITPGGQNVEDLNIEMSEAVWEGENAPAMGSLVSELHVLDSRVYARIDNVPEEGGTSVRLTADFAHTLEMPDDDLYPGIPVSVMASDGAIMGFWKIREENQSVPTVSSVSVNADAEAFHTVTEGGRRVFRGYFSSASVNHSLIQIRGNFIGAEQYQSAPLSLLSTREELDNRSVVVSTSQDGVLFTYADDVFRVWGNNEEPYTVRMINTATRGTSLPSLDLCRDPWFTVEDISTVNEEDSFEMVSASENCRLAVSVSARTLNSSPFATPDTSLTLCLQDNCDVEAVDVTGGSPDTTLYVDAASFSRALIRSRMGTIGYYALNVRSPAIIQQVSLAAENPFVELRMEPGTSMDTCRLQRLDPLILEPTPIAEQALLGVVPDNGKVYVAPAISPFATVSDNAGVSAFDIEENFRLRLMCNNRAMDEFQVGGVKPPENNDTDTTTGAIPAAEPLANYSAQCYRRIGNSIDTNRNAKDFVPVTECTVD